MSFTTLGSLLLALGCARSAPLIPSLLPPESELRQAVATAKAYLDAATREGDAIGMAAIFADTGILVVGADTVRGRDAIGGFIAMLASGSLGARLHFGPRVREACTDGEYERGGEYTVHVGRAAVAVDTLRGRYAARWVWDSLTGMRLATVSVKPGIGNIDPRVPGCPSRSRAALGRRRLQVVGSTALTAWRTTPDVEGTMATRGYRNSEAVRRNEDPSARHLGTEDGAVGWTAGVRARVSSAIGVELTLGPQNRTIRGIDLNRLSNVEVVHSALVVMAAASWDFRGLRVGAGPAFLRSSWTLREYELTQFGNVYGTYYPRTGVLGVQEWRSRTIGAVLEVGYGYPFSSRLAAEVRFSFLEFPDVQTRSTPGFPPADVDQGGHAFALRIAVAP
ncbi:MAG: hypothetical protein ACREN5_11175 [Gemmatimonadales bacterium]